MCDDDPTGPAPFHSAARGVPQLRLAASRSSPPLPRAAREALASGPPVFCLGVGQFRVAPVRLSVAPGWFPQNWESSDLGLCHLPVAWWSWIPPCAEQMAAPLIGVGQDEDPIPFVRGAHVARGKMAPLRIEPECGKFLKHSAETTTGNKTGHVLEPNVSGLDLPDDAGDVVPNPPLVLDALALAGERPRLAWEPRSDEIHCATPASAVEGSNVIPHRRAIQGLLFHPRHDNGRRVAIPLSVSHGSYSFPEGELEAEFEAPSAGAEGKDSEGT